jgi:hypothetical protein
LRGEERWDYAAQILEDLGIPVERGDGELAGLLEVVGGHPLAMQVALLQLGTQSVDELKGSLQRNYAQGLKGESEAQKRLWATLEVGCGALPQEEQVVLVPLAVHGKTGKRGDKSYI